MSATNYIPRGGVYISHAVRKYGELYQGGETSKNDTSEPPINSGLLTVIFGTGAVRYYTGSGYIGDSIHTPFSYLRCVQGLLVCIQSHTEKFILICKETIIDSLLRFLTMR